MTSSEWGKKMNLFLRGIAILALFSFWSPLSTAQQSAGAQGSASAANGSSRIDLDVVVTDKSGKPVRDLSMNDFRLMDEKSSTKIVSLQFSDRSSEPSQVILVLDAVNMGVDEVAFVRQEFQKFLRQNEGQLAQPVSIILFTEDGMRIRPAIQDGNKLAAELDQVQNLLRKADLTNGANGDIARFQLSMNWLTMFVKSEARIPGKKLLIWGGPGWPSLDGPDFSISPKMLHGEFDLIVELSTLLRQGRISVYSISPALKDAQTTAVKSASEGTVSGDGKSSGKSKYSFNSGNVDYGLDSGPFAYKDFVKGVKSVDKATPSHLGLKVLAVQTGGLVLGPGNNLAEQIGQCVQDANSSYRLSFDSPRADKANDYHELRVEVAQKNLTVRSETGYYNQPQGQ